MIEPSALLARVRGMKADMVAFTRRLVEAESPTDDADSQAAVQAILGEALEDLGFRVRILEGRRYGGVLYARPRLRERGRPVQLVLGHTDTVWPRGTLAQMPVTEQEGRLRGPGVFDMKGGLAQAVFALRALAELGAEPPASPVILANADEEVGSPESRRWVEALARRSCRAFVLEPAFGPDGRVKTARKGVGRFTVTAEGRAAHAGLDPEAGASAILEMASLVQRLHALNDPPSGTTVNVGVVEGGTRANVVPARARAQVDVRVSTSADGDEVTRRILEMGATVPGVSVRAEGGIEIPPMEATPGSRRLWKAAGAVARNLGLELGEAAVGGASDGNRASRFTPTLDGLGAVGDGAHAADEHLLVDAWVDRCALLAGLLMLPVDASTEAGALREAAVAGGSRRGGDRDPGSRGGGSG